MAPQAEGGASNPWTALLPWLLIFVVIYFFMIRPQSKKAKEQKAFRENINKGDKIVTIGGIHAKILEVNDTTVIIEVEGQNKLKIEKSAISPENTLLAYPVEKVAKK
jgi:preprotein translocase subunit YajC